MRWIEGLLLVEVLLYFLTFIIFKNKRIGIHTAQAVLLITWFSHLIVEGLRWQLYPVYLLILLLLIIERISNKAPANWLFIMGKIGAVLLWGSSLLLTILLPVFKLPAITGIHSIGSTTFQLKDSTRANRVVSIKAWYPVNENGRSRLGSYHPNPSAAMSGIMGMPGFVFGHLSLVKTQAFDLPVPRKTSKSYPLVIYSHGAMSSNIDNTALMENIASHGYVVLAIEHDFSFQFYGLDPAIAMKPDVATQIVFVDALIQKVVPNQVADYNLLIRSLTQNEQKISQLIDLNKIALLGHSLGGTTAVNASFVVNNVKAVVNMDGPIDERVVKDFAHPLLYISSFSPDLSDEKLKAKSVPIDFYRGLKTHELKSVKKLLEQPNEERNWVRFKEAGHIDLTDLPFMVPLMASKHYDKIKGHQIRSKIIVNFLEKHLKLKKNPSVMDQSIEWLN